MWCQTLWVGFYVLMQQQICPLSSHNVTFGVPRGEQQWHPRRQSIHLAFYNMCDHRSYLDLENSMHYIQHPKHVGDRGYFSSYIFLDISGSSNRFWVFGFWLSSTSDTSNQHHFHQHQIYISFNNYVYIYNSWKLTEKTEPKFEYLNPECRYLEPDWAQIEIA